MSDPDNAGTVPGPTADVPAGTFVATPSPLETRYRRLLRVLPRRYREAREEEMVATFLAAAHDADPDGWDLVQKFDGPDWAERRSVVGLALRLRWGRAVAPERYRVRIWAVHRALFAYLTMAAATALVGAVAQASYALWPLPENVAPAYRLPVSEPTRVWITVSTWAFVAWVPALWSALRGGRSGLWWAAGLASVPSAVAVISAATTPVLSIGPIVATLVDVVAVVALAAVAAAPAPGVKVVSALDADSRLAVRHARGWLVAAGSLTLALAGLTGLLRAGFNDGWVERTGGRAVLMGLGWVQVDEVGPWCWGAVAVGAVLAVRARRGRRLDTSSLLGLALFAGAVAVMRSGTGMPWVSAALHTAGVSTADRALLLGSAVAVAAQLAVTASVCVISGVLAARRFRQLPTARWSIAPLSRPRDAASHRR